MIDQWDRFGASAGRTLAGLGYDDNVDVYQPEETYTPGEGYDVHYPDVPTATLTGALEPPSTRTDVDPGGTTEQADLTVYVRADVPIQFQAGGRSGEAETGVIVDGLKYIVDDIDDQQDGWLGLGCDEVDTWA